MTKSLVTLMMTFRSDHVSPQQSDNVTSTSAAAVDQGAPASAPSLSTEAGASDDPKVRALTVGEWRMYDRIKQFRDRAEECRRHADDMSTEEAKSDMRQLAMQYERIADRYERERRINHCY